MNAVKTAFALIVILALPVAALSQTVEEVIVKSIEARGGEAALKAVDTVIMRGVLTLTEQGISVTYTHYKKRPKKVRVDIEYQDKVLIRATDGRTCWQINSFAGSEEPVLMPGDQAETFLRWADFDGPLVDMESKGVAAELVGMESVNGQQCYHLRIVYPDGSDMRIFISDSTHLIYQVRMRIPSDSGKVDGIANYSDYALEGDLMIPHRITQDAAGEESVLEIAVYRVNEPIDDGIFVKSDK